MKKVILPISGIFLSVFLAGCFGQSGSIGTVEIVGTPQGTTPTQQFEVNIDDEIIATRFFEATEADVKGRLLGQERFAVYFSAPDCPECESFEEELNERLDELADDLIVAKLDYVEEVQFRREFAVNFPSSVLTFAEDGGFLELLIAPDLDQVLLSLYPEVE